MPEPGAKTVALGRTHLSVSKLCFGTSALGDMPDTYGYGVDEHRAKETIRAIFAGPVNFLDTSRNYGLGRSEERIGAVIRERGGLPAGFVLSTKLDRDPDTGRFNAAQARRSFEENLIFFDIGRSQLPKGDGREVTVEVRDVYGQRVLTGGPVRSEMAPPRE